MMKEIVSRDNPKIKKAYSLKLKKNREETGLFLCEGIKNLKMALTTNSVETIFTNHYLDLDIGNAEIFKVPDDIIDKLSNEKNPEGIVFACKKINWDKNCARYGSVVYLDEITDPGNMGTIIRTALALNYDAVILSKNCVDIYNEKVVAASKGSIFMIPVFEAPLEELNDKPIYVSTLQNDSIDLNLVQRNTNFVLVLGNESHGVSENSIKLANYKVKINISEKIDSLNVAVAAGILMNSLKSLNK